MSPARRFDGMRLTLQTRFMLTFGLVVVGVMVTVIVVAGQRQHRTALSQIEKRGAVIAQSVASAATPALYEYDNSSMQRLADEVRADTGALYVIIHNKENAVGGYSGHPELQGTLLGDAVSETAIALAERSVQRHGGLAAGVPQSAFGEVLEVAMPVHAGGERWGTVRVGLSLAEMREELARTLRDLGLLGLSAVILVLVSARLLTGRVTSPLRELAAATAKVADGDLDHTINEDLLAELGDVARGFNQMTQDLRRSRDALRYQKQHLENMVQERTAALRQKARELEKANRELKEVDRLKSDFLSNVSHELRTPLTSIRSFTEILLDEEQPVTPDEKTEFLEIIAGQTDRLTRLIGDLLDLSKIEAGEFYCNVDTVPLVGLVLAPSMETVKHIAAEARVEIVPEFPSDLPVVLADSDRLSQVTMNLLDNALKFTEPGGTISIRAFRSERRVPEETLHGEFHGVESDTPEGGAYIVVEVRDNGRGIPLGDQQRIFEKFGQVGNVLTNKPQGTGLGLTISASIMSHLGGAIWVHSVEGAGSTFWYSVPVHGESANGAASRPKIQPRPKTVKVNVLDRLVRALDENAHGPRVLVVDDQEEVIERITSTLEPLGYRAMGCVGGRLAFDRVRDLEPDVVVLDAVMPDVSGYEVLRRLKQDPRTCNTAVVVLGPENETRKAYELGATDHVVKDGLLESDYQVPVRT